MEWKELAPWITIAITLILSILTPLLTQIANNKFKSKQDKILYEQKITDEKRRICYDFAEKVGACIAFAQKEEVKQAGAIIEKMYMVMPEDTWNKLDMLFPLVKAYKWDDAEPLLKDLCKEASRIISCSDTLKKRKSR